MITILFNIATDLISARIFNALSNRTLNKVKSSLIKIFSSQSLSGFSFAKRFLVRQAVSRSRFLALQFEKEGSMIYCIINVSEIQKHTGYIKLGITPDQFRYVR